MATVKGSPGPNAQANGPWRIKFKPGYGWDEIAARYYNYTEGTPYEHWRDARTMCDRINALAAKLEGAAKRCEVEKTTGFRYCTKCKRSSLSAALTCSNCGYPLRPQPNPKRRAR